MELKNLEKYDINPVVVEEYIRKVRDQESIIVVTGEFSSGKTCFVNAFLNKENYLPHANGECTPVLLDIMKSSEQNMVVRYKSGEERRVEATEDNIKKYAKYTKEYDLGILAISIPVNSDYLDFNTHFIDSPGTNTIIKEHEEITKYILKKSDIVIYVFNKAIAQSDISNIREILKYTDDIIFVITHMDVERNSEYLYREEAEVDRFIDEAKEQLKNSLNIEDAEIYPIGSRASYKNERYIKAIREIVRQYRQVNSFQIIKNRVKRQLRIIFEEKLKEFEQSNKLFLSVSNLDRAEIDEKLKSFHNKISNFSKLEEQRVKQLQVLAEKKKGKLAAEVQKIFKNEEEKITARILSNKDITEEIILEEFSNTNTTLGEKLKDKLEATINDLSIEIYNTIGDEINSIIGTIDIQLDTDIRKPTIDELDDADHRVQMEEVINIQRKCLEELRSVEQEIAATETEKEEIRKSIEDVNENIGLYREEMKRLGYYIPDYREEVIEGGGGAGAKLGRLVGEVADIALIFVNPTGGVVKAADAVKDTAKGASYVQKALSDANSQPVKHAIDLKKHADKAKKVLNNVDKTRKNIKSYGEEIQEMPGTGSEIIDGIGKTLDLLSLGYWGEKVGKSIGEALKPTATIFMEDENKRLLWEAKRNEIKESIDENLRKQRELEESLREVNTIKESFRLKRELEDK